MIPERLSRDQIERHSLTSVIWPLERKVGKQHLIERGLRFKELYDLVIRPTYGITIRERLDLRSLCGGRGALGAYYPDENAVEIDVSMDRLFRDPQRVFTLYHEVCGHGVLQGEWLRSQPSRSAPLIENEQTVDPRNMSVLEWQANTMAGLCAAPTWLVRAQLAKRLEITRPLRYLGPRTYHLGPSGSVRRFEVVSWEDYCGAIASLIRPWFDGLSAQALSYRVMRSGMVHGRPQPRRSLFRAA